MSVEPCPTCGQTVREAFEARMGQMRARTQLMTSLAGENLTTVEIAEVVTGVRPVAEVLAARDERVSNNAPQRKEEQ